MLFNTGAGVADDEPILFYDDDLPPPAPGTGFERLDPKEAAKELKVRTDRGTKKLLGKLQREPREDEASAGASDDPFAALIEPLDPPALMQLSRDIAEIPILFDRVDRADRIAELLRVIPILIAFAGLLGLAFMRGRSYLSNLDQIPVPSWLSAHAPPEMIEHLPAVMAVVGVFAPIAVMLAIASTVTHFLRAVLYRSVADGASAVIIGAGALFGLFSLSANQPFTTLAAVLAGWAGSAIVSGILRKVRR